jgi:hypothetical protein
MHFVYSMARENAMKSAVQARRWYNRKVHEAVFKPDERVLLYNARRYRGRSPK